MEPLFDIFSFTLQLLLDVRSKAIDLVDSVLEQSVQYLSSRLEQSQIDHDHRGPQTVRFENHQHLELDDYEYAKQNNFFDQPPTLNVNIADHFLHSDSENFAITCDLSNGAEFLKSPTIESISGKSFDDNMSPHDEHDLIGLDLQLPMETIEARSSGPQVISERSAHRIDRQFERLSSELEMNDMVDLGAGASDLTAIGALDGEDVSQLQNEFSKLSWDDTQSATTTVDPSLGTPDNDLHGPEGD